MKKAFNAYDQLRMQYYDIVSNNDKLKQLQDVNDAISKAINEIKTKLSSSGAVQVTDSVVQATVRVYTDSLLNLLELQEKLKYSMSEVIPDEDEGYGNDRSVWRKRVNRVPLSPSDFIIPFRISRESHSD